MISKFGVAVEEDGCDGVEDGGGGEEDGRCRRRRRRPWWSEDMVGGGHGDDVEEAGSLFIRFLLNCLIIKQNVINV